MASKLDEPSELEKTFYNAFIKVEVGVKSSYSIDDVVTMLAWSRNFYEQVHELTYKYAYGEAEKRLMYQLIDSQIEG
jgi:hypothetical protein